MRLFFAIEIPEPIRLAAAELSQEMRKKTPPEIRIGWIKPEHMHLTLVFMGKTPAEGLQAARQAGQSAGASLAPFEISLAGLGAFPSLDNLQVLWIGLEQGTQDIAKVSSSLRRELQNAGVEFDQKEFHPHLTLARNKGMKTPDAKSLVLPPAQKKIGSWTVSSISLFESKLTPYGPQYRKEIEIRLG